jgi:demethylmenaquinone methyltransferase/2-methoxy-6-polyprenyl-1,4-benzoquinol methylase
VHFSKVVPLLGRAVSRHPDAYRYLPVSVDHFLTRERLSSRLRGAGFEVTRVRGFGVGTVALHVASVAE